MTNVNIKTESSVPQTSTLVRVDKSCSLSGDNFVTQSLPCIKISTDT